MTVVVQAHFTFGLRPEVANNICFLDDQTIIFPSGNNCVTYNIDQKWQRFIPGTEKRQHMQAIALSSNRRYLAVAETSEKGTITVYDLRQEQSRKRKVLSGGDISVQEFVCLAFSTDSKYLIGQTGGPDWTLFYWMWEKQRLMATVKASGITNPINQVSFNPQNNTEICVTGNGVFKFVHYTEGALKQTSFPKLESYNFLSHAWMSAERVIAGTDTGRLLVLDSGDLRWEMSVMTNVSTLEAKSSHERKKQNDTAVAEASSPPRVTSIAAYSRGFACSAGKGMVCLFEKTEEKDSYMKTREILIPEDQFSIEPSQAQQQDITTLCISPSEETLAASTDTGQLYSIALSSAEISKGEQAHFDFLTHPFHSGVITGLSICIRKPIIATCSLDRTVRIWNYESNTLELYKGFQEEPYSIALHPSGLFILVGFSDKLRLMNLLTNDIRMFKEFTVRGCRECAFSHGGHMFAAVNGNIIHIYSSTTFENTLNLKGHNGKVRAVIWSPDDSRLMSCGMDGAVYEWNTLNSKREAESVLKSCSYTSIVISPDASTVFSVGTDCTLKEIQSCQILREVPAEDVVYTTIVMSRSGRMLFVGTSVGTIRAIEYPLPVKNTWTEYQGHAAPITKMAITFDDQFLLTVSEDNCLLIWKLTDKEGRGLKRDKEVHYAEEILITKFDLEEKNQMIVELKTRVEELNIEKEYQLRMKDMNYNEKIKELTEKFVQKMEGLKAKNQVLSAEKEKQEIVHRDSMMEIMEKHSKELQDLESNNNKKLMLEYEKYQELLVKTQCMEEEYEQKLRSVEENKTRTLEELTQNYESKLKENLLVLEQHQDESRQQLWEMEESIKQTEEDGDREILDMRIKYERKLKEEKEATLRFLGEIGVMEKKFISMQQEIENRNLDIKKMKVEQQKLQDVIKYLEKDIQGLRKEIQKRDETIQDKELCISDLKKKNQELEKFNFVLDYKISDLKKLIEPKENEIKETKEQVQEMENELGQHQKKNTQLKLNITDLKEKLRAAKLEKDKEMRKVQNMEALLRHLKTDLHNCAGHIQEPRKLKESIRELYHHYVQHSDVVDIVEVDADIQKDFIRQREHLEHTVASLKRKLSIESHVQHSENIKLMRENSFLIMEINDLRRELKIVRDQLGECKRQGNVGKNLGNRQNYSVGKDLTTGLSAPHSAKEEAERGFLLQRKKAPQLHQYTVATEHAHTQQPVSATSLPALSVASPLSTNEVPAHQLL